MVHLHGKLMLLLLLALVGGIGQPSLRPHSREVELSGSANINLLGHLGSSALAVAIQDELAYVGFRHELVVLDVHDPAHPYWVTAITPMWSAAGTAICML